MMKLGASPAGVPKPRRGDQRAVIRHTAVGLPTTSETAPAVSQSFRLVLGTDRPRRELKIACIGYPCFPFLQTVPWNQVNEKKKKVG